MSEQSEGLNPNHVVFDLDAPRAEMPVAPETRALREGFEQANAIKAERAAEAARQAASAKPAFTQPPPAEATRETAQREIELLQSGRDFEFSAAYSSASHPNHGAAVTRMNRLYEIVHAPGGEAQVNDVESLEQRIVALKADKAFSGAWLDGGHPQHQEAVDKMNALIEEKVGAEADAINPLSLDGEHYSADDYSELGWALPHDASQILGSDVVLPALEQAKGIFEQLQIPPNQARGFLSRHVEALLRPVPEAKRNDQLTRGMDYLKNKHGEELPAKLDLARDFVASIDGLADALDESGLGDDPYVIGLAIDLAEKRKAATQ